MEKATADNALHVSPPVGKRNVFPEHLSLMSAISVRGTTVGMATTSKQLDLGGKRRRPKKREGNVWMVNVEGYSAEMRKLYMATHPAFVTGQIIDAQTRRDEPASMDLGLPSPSRVEHWTRLWAQYRRQIDAAIDPSTELQVLSSLMFFVQVIYLPEGQNPGGVVGEELLDWLNTIDVRPTSEEMVDYAVSEPWRADGFWTYLQRLVLRGHFLVATTVLEGIVAQHPSALLRDILATLLAPLFGSFPRASGFSYQTMYEEARFRWDTDLKTARRSFEGMVKGVRDDWVDAIRGLFEVMDGQQERIFAVVKDDTLGWVEAIGVWGLWVDPSMTRSDLSDRWLDSILEAVPLDPTSRVDMLRVALIRGDAPKALALTAEGSSWLVAHMVDTFQKMQFMDEQYLEGGESENIRSFYILDFCNHLLADPSMFTVAFDYAHWCGPAGRTWLGENITKISLGIRAPTSPVELEPEGEGAQREDGEQGPADGEMDLDLLVLGTKKDYRLPGNETHQLEQLMRDCISNELEDELREICKVASETFARQRNYGWAVSYAIRARDVRRLRWISERLMGEYVRYGAKTFLRYAKQLPKCFLLEGTEDEEPMPPDHVFYAPSLRFVCRYYLFQKFYSDSEWRLAADLLVMLLKSGLAPKKWWGILLLDTLAFLQEGDILINYDDTLELLRCLEEVFMGATQGCADDYLEGMVAMQTKGDNVNKVERKRAEKEALDKLSTVRLALARQVARCCVISR